MPNLERDGEKITGFMFIFLNNVCFGEKEYSYSLNAKLESFISGYPKMAGTHAACLSQSSLFQEIETSGHSGYSLYSFGHR